jgi:hypothetical protein
VASAELCIDVFVKLADLFPNWPNLFPNWLNFFDVPAGTISGPTKLL